MSEDDRNSRNMPQDETLLALSMLADALQPEPAPASVRTALLHHMQNFKYAPFEDEVVSTFGVTLPALRDAFARLHDVEAWVPGPWHRSRVLITAGLSAAGTIIADLAPGTEIAHHRHEHLERTYVLEGELVELGARTLHAGDLLVVRRGQAHALSVADGAHCMVVFSNRPM